MKDKLIKQLKSGFPGYLLNYHKGYKILQKFVDKKLIEHEL